MRARFATHQATRDIAVAPCAIQQAMRSGLVVIGNDLEFLILLVRTGFRSGAARAGWAETGEHQEIPDQGLTCCNRMVTIMVTIWLRSLENNVR